MTMNHWTQPAHHAGLEHSTMARGKISTVYAVVIKKGELAADVKIEDGANTMIGWISTINTEGNEPAFTVTEPKIAAMMALCAAKAANHALELRIDYGSRYEDPKGNGRFVGVSRISFPDR